MGEFTVYILKSAVFVAIFFLFYKLLLSRETLHRFNRVLLIGILLLSFVLPFIKITTTKDISPVPPANELFELITNAYADTGAEAGGVPLWAVLIVTIYFIGAIITAVLLVVAFVRMQIIIRGSELHSIEGKIKIYITDREIAPFSWMNSFVINRRDMEEEGDIVAVHEKAHIKSKHSVDILLSQMAIMFQWFNPAIYLLKQELQAIHEFEADEAVLKQGIDAKKYQLLLIKKAVGPKLFTMANSFNHGKLKKRITMMVRKKSKRTAVIKALFILPAAAIALIAFASEKVSAKTEIISKAEVLLPSPVDNTPAQSADTVKLKLSNGKKPVKRQHIEWISKNGEEKILINGKEVSKDSLKKLKITLDTIAKGQILRLNIVDDQNDNDTTRIIYKKHAEGRNIEKRENIVYVSHKNEGKDTLHGKVWITTSNVRTEHQNTGKSMSYSYSYDSNGTVKGEKVNGVFVKKDSVVVIDVKPSKYTDSKSNTIIIHGSGAVGKADPYYIIDGKEQPAIPTTLVPNDIESISILKGEAAIKLYGDKGKNGVIIITTKKAK